MPNYRGHLIGGLCAYIAVTLLLSLHLAPISKHIAWFIATLAGSLFPDIDVRSTGQRLFLQLLLFLLVICLFLQAYIPVIFVLSISLLPIIIPHRSLFHNLKFIALITACLSLFLIYTVPDKTNTILMTTAFFLLGVISHLVLDKGFRKAFS